MSRATELESLRAGWTVRARPDRGFALWITAAFALLVAFTMAHHEMWSDEASAWQVARGSESIAALLQEGAYQGHPSLWTLLLRPLARLTRTPAAMQALHLVLAAAGAYLVASRGPFPRVYRALLAFSYYLVYEYAVISRNYAPGILLFFLFCAVFAVRRSRFLAVGTVLFLLPQASVYGLIFAAAGVAALLVDERVGDAAMGAKRLAFCVGAAALGAALSVAQILPPPDQAFGGPWRFDLDGPRLARVLQLVPRAFAPFPSADQTFWWPSWHFHPLFLAVGTPVALALLGWIVALLLRHPAALIAWAVAGGGMLTFAYTKHFGYLRHHGLLFVAFVGALWLAAASTPIRSIRLRALAAPAARALPPLLGALLIVQVLGAAKAIRADLRLPFSNAKRTAEVIRESGLERLPIVGDPELPVSAVLAHLENGFAYWVRGERRGAFVHWDKARQVDVTPQRILDFADRVATREASDVLLVLNERLPQQLLRPERIASIASVEGAVIPYENFYVYRLALDSDRDGVGDDRDPEPQNAAVSGSCRDLVALARRIGELADEQFVAEPERGRQALAGTALRAARQCRQGKLEASAGTLRSLRRRIDGKPSPSDWLVRSRGRRRLRLELRQLLAAFEARPEVRGEAG